MSQRDREEGTDERVVKSTIRERIKLCDCTGDEQ